MKKVLETDGTGHYICDATDEERKEALGLLKLYSSFV